VATVCLHPYPAVMHSSGFSRFHPCTPAPPRLAPSCQQSTTQVPDLRPGHRKGQSTMPWPCWLVLTLLVVIPAIYAPTPERRAAARALLALLLGRDPEAAARAEADLCQSREVQTPCRISIYRRGGYRGTVIHK
jgi:hypothetical protein